jgi:phage terminase large subunit-like protein
MSLRFTSYEMTKRVCFSQLFILKNSDYSFESIQRELRNRVVIYSWFDRIRAFAISERP